MNPRYYEFDLTNKCELLNQMHITTHVLSITDCLVQLCLDLLLNSERSHVVPEQLIQWHCRIYNCFQICKIDEVLKAEIFFGREDYVEAQAVYRQLLEKDEKVCILPCPSPSSHTLVRLVEIDMIISHFFFSNTLYLHLFTILGVGSEKQPYCHMFEFVFEVEYMVGLARSRNKMGRFTQVLNGMARTLAAEPGNAHAQAARALG